MVLLKIALLHLIVSGWKRADWRRGGSGLSDGLGKEHLIQSGDDIKKCYESAVWLCSYKAKKVRL